MGALWQRGCLALEFCTNTTPGHLLLLHSIVPQVTHKAGVVLHIQSQATEEEDSTVHAVAIRGCDYRCLVFPQAHSPAQHALPLSLTQRPHPPHPNS